MENDHNMYIINQNISKKHINTKSQKAFYVDFRNYQQIEVILKNQEGQAVKIYDTTQNQQTVGTTVPVNDHINRIGNNPFIGKQRYFGIDFINIEKLYKQHDLGITTNSCGDHSPKGSHTSTHLANIAIMAHVFNFKVEAFLVNT